MLKKLEKLVNYKLVNYKLVNYKHYAKYCARIIEKITENHEVGCLARKSELESKTLSDRGRFLV